MARAGNDGPATIPASATSRPCSPACPSHAGLITVLDGHPATLSWMAGVGRHKTQSLGVETFGQSADLLDLYRVAGIDSDAIVDAAARLCLTA